MQATAVLCREICDGFRHAPERASVHKQAAHTSVELLSNLSKNCESSKMALKLVKPLVEHLLSNDGKVENKMEEDEETDGDAVGEADGEADGGVKGVPGVEEVGEEVDNVEPNHFQGIMEGLLAPDSYPTSHFQTDVLRIIQSIPVDMPPQFVDPSQVSLGGGFLTEEGFPYPSSCTDNLYHLVTRSRDPGQYGSGYYYPI
ncbi:hypothetical protein ASPCAL09151 [Aspergillus calidoustus]|uniref:Uncharacterized protein n=1 Tax=Aspergillus calidoustus TaxID=454130 RepID=A0A0U5GSD9_ASPCI|nr:hypothetical protein ASPCAL09151 [Aspergillus calidoustus]